MKKGIYLAEINEERLLLVRKKDIWILPGGKLENGESDSDCLFRELKEELSVSKQQFRIYNFYKSFIGRTPFSNALLEAKVYFGRLRDGLIKPNNEINDVKFIRNFKNYKISEITNKIINSLKKDKYL